MEEIRDISKKIKNELSDIPYDTILQASHIELLDWVDLDRGKGLVDEIYELIVGRNDMIVVVNELCSIIEIHEWKCQKDVKTVIEERKKDMEKDNNSKYILEIERLNYELNSKSKECDDLKKKLKDQCLASNFSEIPGSMGQPILSSSISSFDQPIGPTNLKDNSDADENAEMLKDIKEKVESIYIKLPGIDEVEYSN